jgi:hypothetical protein
VALFDGTEEHPPSKALRYLITTLVFIALIAGACWYLLRFHTEKHTVHHFMDAVVAGKMDEAYRIWRPSSSYSMKDFLDDFGPDGYYGPVKSYRIESAERLKDGSSGVIVVAEVSPYQPFPDDHDAKASKTKEVRLWVEFKDQSLSFPP